MYACALLYYVTIPFCLVIATSKVFVVTRMYKSLLIGTVP